MGIEGTDQTALAGLRVLGADQILRGALYHLENLRGCGSSWKPVCGFQRAVGRVLCVHGPGSLHNLFMAERVEFEPLLRIENK